MNTKPYPFLTVTSGLRLQGQTSVSVLPFLTACRAHLLLVGDADFDGSRLGLDRPTVSILFLPSSRLAKNLRGSSRRPQTYGAQKCPPRFVLGKGHPVVSSSRALHGPRGRRGRLLGRPPGRAPQGSSCPALACSCQEDGESGRAERPRAALGLTPGSSYVWVTVINVMLIPTRMMGARPRGSRYNQLMKTRHSPQTHYHYEKSPENTQETRPLSCCWMTDWQSSSF